MSLNAPDPTGDADATYDLAPSTLPGGDLEDALTPRDPRRARTLRLFVALGMLALVAGLAYAFTVGARPQASVSNSGRVAVPQLTLLTNVTTPGVFAVNGTTLHGRMNVSFTPRAGTSVVTLHAPPFAPKTCTLQVANQRLMEVTGNCALVGDAAQPVALDGAVIHMPLTLADLPDDMQAAVAAELQASYRGAAAPEALQVPAGDYFAAGNAADGAIISQRAAVPLLETQRAVLDVARIQPYFLQDGLLNVDVPDQRLLLTGMWSVGWQFTTPAGAVVGSAIFPYASYTISTSLAFAPQGMPVVDNSFLPYDGGAPLTACDLAQAALTNRDPSGQHSTPVLNPAHPLDRGAAGCALYAGLDLSAPLTARFLWRFGVLLAVNSAAQALAPDLPLAPPDEIMAVVNGPTP